MPEPWGTIVNVVGIVYLVVVLFFSYWPTAANPTPADMNWSVLVVGAVGIVSIVYYMVWARKVYVRPARGCKYSLDTFCLAPPKFQVSVWTKLAAV